MQSTCTPVRARRFVKRFGHSHPLSGMMMTRRSAIELHTGRFANRERRAQGRHWHAARNAIGRVETGKSRRVRAAGARAFETSATFLWPWWCLTTEANP